MFVRRLVRGVRSSWPASETSWACWSLDSGQTSQHGVEAASQTSQLVVALVVDGRGEVLGRRNVLDGHGEVFDRPDAGPPDRPAEARSESHAAECDQDEGRPQVGERVVDVCQLVADLHDQAPDIGRDAHHPVTGAVTGVKGLVHRDRVVGVFLQGLLGPGRHREDPLVARKPCSPLFLRGYLQEIACTLLEGHQFVGRHAIAGAVGAGDETQWRPAGRGRGRQKGDGGLEVGRDLVLQLTADCDVGHQRGEGDGDADGYADQDADPAAEADFAQPRQREPARCPPPLQGFRRAGLGLDVPIGPHLVLGLDVPIGPHLVLGPAGAAGVARLGLGSRQNDGWRQGIGGRWICWTVVVPLPAVLRGPVQFHGTGRAALFTPSSPSAGALRSRRPERCG